MSVDNSEISVIEVETISQGTTIILKDGARHQLDEEIRARSSLNGFISLNRINVSGGGVRHLPKGVFFYVDNQPLSFRSSIIGRRM